jgi:replicative DNA helicase
LIENTILSALVFNEDYVRQILPYLTREYFNDAGQQVVFKLISDHVGKYNSLPTPHSLMIDLDTHKLAENPYNAAKALISKLASPPVDYKWLVDSTEQFCKTMALHNAIGKSAALIASEKSDDYSGILEIVKTALSVSFDSHIGHDWLLDAEQRIDKHLTKKNKLRCDLESFNAVLRGGFLEKTLTVFLLPTGKGKSLIMCHMAAGLISLGKNVLYITLEMPEDQVGGRIDSNALNIPMDRLDMIDKITFMGKVAKLQKGSLGKLIIKEYAAHSVHVGHFRHLINELKLKKNFIPDAIIVDYLGLCRAAAVGKDANSYERQKTAAEEIRGLGMEFNCRVFTAAQVNKEGTKAVDFSITDTAESWGVPATADYMFGGVITDEMERLGQIKIVRLKDRHNDVVRPASFMLGIDRNYMRLFDLEIDQIEQQIATSPAVTSGVENSEDAKQFMEDAFG